MGQVARGLNGASRRWRHLRGSLVRRWVRALHQGVSWQGPGQWGRGCGVSVASGGALRIGAGVDFAAGARLFVRGGSLEIGAGSFVGYGALIVARERVAIGRDVQIAEYVTIRDQDHVPGQPGAFRTAPIEIGDRVWLGAKATVTRGVRIGAESVIGANAVVTRDIPAGVVAAGIPARVLKERV